MKKRTALPPVVPSMAITSLLALGNEDGVDRLQNLSFTCYNSELGPKYIEISFQLGTGNTLTDSVTESALSFRSGVSLRN